MPNPAFLWYALVAYQAHFILPWVFWLYYIVQNMNHEIRLISSQRVPERYDYVYVQTLKPGYYYALISSHNIYREWTVYFIPIQFVLFLVNFHTKRVHLDHDRDVKIGILDTAGIERSDTLSAMCCRRAHAAIVVYDITQKNSFYKARSWFERLPCHANPNIFKALVGNKADLVSKRDVEYEVI